MAAVTPDSAQKGLPLTLPPPSAGLPWQQQKSTSSSNLVSSSVDSTSGEQSADAGFSEVEMHAKPGNGHHVWGGVSANNSTHHDEEIQAPYIDEEMLESHGINPMEIVFHQPDSQSDWTDSSESVRADPRASAAFGEPDSSQKDHWVDVEDNSEDSCSDSDPETTRPKCSPETERAVQKQKELIRAEAGDDVEKLTGRVPQDREGNPTSIGSVGHYAGCCKICNFANSKVGCINGVSCNFCHFPHKRRNKVRHCKGKRERHLKLLAKVLAQIDHDPDGFSLDKLKLPPSIVCEEKAWAKFMAKVESHLKQVKSARSSPGTEARSSAARSSGAGSGMPARTVSERGAEKPNRVSL